MTETAGFIAYKAGYKYQLVATYLVRIPIRPSADIVTEYILLGTDGNMTIMDGYAWDGPSGPTIDTPDSMRGSLVHDALYQLMRGGQLDRMRDREAADKILRDLCIEDGMPAWRADLWYVGVRDFAAFAADESGENTICYAPVAPSPARP